MSTTNGTHRPPPGPLSEWLRRLGQSVPSLGRLLAAPEDEQLRRGYAHTLREIAQQPLTWEGTAAGLAAAADRLHEFLRGTDRPGHVLLTGSGSSRYVGECLRHFLRASLGSTVSVVAAGDLLTHETTSLPARGLTLTVSFARSGNSPESVAVLERLRRRAPEARHLIMTCNREGRLAVAGSRPPSVQSLVLDEATNDRSLVMTSSFTNLVLAGRWLGTRARPDGGAEDLSRLAGAGRALLAENGGRLLELGQGGFTSACYLGTGDALGAAREASLKMLEMTSGEVRPFAESFLELRHGPMSALRPDTLLVAFLSPPGPARAYEHDLLAELGRKGLGSPTIVVGESLPAGLAAEGRTLIEWPTTGVTGTEVLAVVVGQLLAFGRCLSLGLSPDAPSREDVITRVVAPFPIYEAEA